MTSKVTNFDESKFTKGFNCGYILAKYSPELVSQIGRSLDSKDNYMNGILLGITQFNKEVRQFNENVSKRELKEKSQAKEKRKKQFVIPDAWKKISIPEKYLDIKNKLSPVYKKWVEKEIIKMTLRIDEKLFIDIVKKGEIEFKVGGGQQLWNLHQILQLFGIDLKYYKKGLRSAINSTNGKK